MLNNLESRTIKCNNKTFNVYSLDEENSFWDEVENGIWEPYTLKVFDNYINKNTTMLDIGAEIGATTLYPACNAKRIYAVEPSVVAFKKLSQNVDLNPLLKNKITLINGCISHKTDDFIYGINSELFSDIHFTVNEHNNTIKGYTLDDFVNKFNIEKIDFIKMDIEGGEYLILPAMKKYINQHKPTLLISLHPGFLRIKMSNILFKAINIFNRYIDHLKLIFLFKSYKYCFDIENQKKISLFQLLSFRYIKSQSASDSSILLTDTKWNKI